MSNSKEPVEIAVSVREHVTMTFHASREADVNTYLRDARWKVHSVGPVLGGGLDTVRVSASRSSDGGDLRATATEINEALA